MNISKLYGNHKKETIYVIGTGPSMRVFPVDFLTGKTTIGLNGAWQLLDLTYCLTIHPDEHIPRNYLNRETKWITKRKGWLENPGSKQLNGTFWFNNPADVKEYGSLVTKNNFLYVGRGIHTAAMSLAAKMGASFCVLVGCDMRAINADHHSIDQTTRFHGLHEGAVYREYFLNAQIVRSKLKNHFGMETISLTPFLGGYYNEDYSKLCHEKNLSSMPPVKDDSNYSRKYVDFS